jgi:hypothetical protein
MRVTVEVVDVDEQSIGMYTRDFSLKVEDRKAL